MKIGFSFGRCVRDIVNGTVDYDDVLLVYAATSIPERDQLEWLIDSYLDRPGYLAGLDRSQCIGVAERLWDNAKIFQPRLHGRGRSMNAESGVWMDLAPTVTGDAQDNELVKKTWRDYQMALKLASPEALPTDQFKRDPLSDEDWDLLRNSIF